MIMDIGVIIGNCVAALSLIASLFYFRRGRKAEIAAKELGVKSQEIGTAAEMVELVRKAHAQTLELKENIIKSLKENKEETKKDNEKLRKTIKRLENALRAINACPYRAECPITDVLHGNASGDGISNNISQV